MNIEVLETDPAKHNITNAGKFVLINTIIFDNLILTKKLLDK